MNDNLSDVSPVRIKYMPTFQVFLPGEKIVLNDFMLTEDIRSLLKEVQNNPDELFGILPKNAQTDYFVGFGTFFSVQYLDEKSAILLMGKRFYVKNFAGIKNGFYNEVIVEPQKSQNKNLNEVFNESPSLEKLFRQVLSNLKENKKFLISAKQLERHTAGEVADYLTLFIPLNNFSARVDLLATDDETERLDKAMMYLSTYIKSGSPNTLKPEPPPREDIDEIKEFQKKLNEIKGSLNKEVRNEIQKEIKSLAKTPPSSGNYDYIYKWLEFALSFYSLKPTKDNQDINSVWKILDESHYGLLKAKERVHEELIVRHLNPKKKGPILCFVGPPGTGKTSMGKAIAESLGRNFVRISLGGVRDEGEIRGHKRTYVGALPGKILEYVLKSKSSNPLLMIDEIDKVGKDTLKGNIEAALLEVFDPEQNHAFSDNYMRIPVDISKVMIICTANTWEGILSALKDRMERLLFSGYTLEEKINIAQKFLIRKQAEENGFFCKKLPIKKLKFSNKSLSSIVGSYTNEAGVRNLEREIGCLLRKVVKGVRTGHTECKDEMSIGVADVRKLLGPPKQLPEKIEETPSGVAIGAAVTEYGGLILKIESLVVNKEGEGKLQLTGNLERTIKESAEAALSFLRAHIASNKEEKMKNHIHLHIPRGGVPKDGPSAGVAIVSALCSLFKEKPVKKGLVMTGEINLSGEVLAVGGIKEKVLAAERAGATEFILPSDNENDLEELSLKTRKKLKFHPVETIDEVFDIAFPGRK